MCEQLTYNTYTRTDWKFNLELTNSQKGKFSFPEFQIIHKLKSHLQKSDLLRLLRRHTPRNDRKNAIRLCERSAAISLLNTFASTAK
jgi:hypothetical protein